MAEAKALRRIEDPVRPPRRRARGSGPDYVPAAEDEALTAIGAYLGSVYRSGWLSGSVWAVGLQGAVRRRAERKQALTSVSSSRWAGAITRAVEDQYQLGMRGLAAHVADLRAAVEVLEARCALRPSELGPADHSEAGRSEAAFAAASSRLSQRGRALRQDPAAGSAARAAGCCRVRRRGIRRSRWVESACGAHAITSTPPN